MDYLVYVEHNAENLQFFLWFKDYSARFDALSPDEKALSPEWVPVVHEIPNLSKDTEKKIIGANRQTATSMMNNGYDSAVANIFNDDKEIALRQGAGIKDACSIVGSTISETTTLTTADFTAQAGLKWQPCKCTL